MPSKRSLVRTLVLCSLFCAGLCAATPPLGAEEPTKLLRFPDLHADRVVFTYAGDLWLAPSDGGTARRLTSHPGLEQFAKFSPDGSQIAFTGQYDGDEQVYVISSEGGTPRQLTFYPAQGPLAPRWGYDNQVYGWAPDGSAVLFRSMRDGWDLGDTKLHTVSVEGGLPERLPMPESGGGDFSPDGRSVVYSPLFRDFRHWKRYQGGWAQDLYVFDLESHEARRITDHPRSDRDPMWIGEKVYFSSDRDGTLNLYAFDLASGATEQLTRFDSWDLRWPSADAAGRRIVFELAGELQVFDLAAGAARPIEIRVPDDGVSKRPARVAADQQVEGFGLSPQGERAVFAARGDIFTVPIEHGPTRNLTRSSGAHDREPAWSPDGRKIAFVSDLAGEENVHLVDQDGHGEPEQLTERASGRLYGLAWSPDGKRIAYSDQQGKLYVLEVATRESTEVADDSAAFGLDYTWSPDSRFLAFSLAGDTALRTLHVWSLDDGVLHRVGSGLWNEYSPSWDPAGKYLYYLSDRELAPQIGSFEFNYVVDRETAVFALALAEDTPHPFPPRSDEVTADGDEGEDTDEENGGEKDGEEGDDTEDAPEPVVIDFEGLGERVARVPLEADNYFGVAALEGHLLTVHGFAFYYGRQSDRQAEARLFSIEDREETPLATDVQNAALSADGKKLLVQSSAGYQLFDAAPGGEESAKQVSIAGLRVDRVPAEEWEQIFDEVWRRFRDFFYVENMHGYDWPALRDQYRPLLAHVGHRSDLNYLMSEMIAELNVSHAYVTGGDYQVPERPTAALLGARFELDEESGRFRIADVFEGQNAEPSYRSPLTEVGVDVSEGDYLLSINGVELTAGDNPFRLLRHAGDANVELTVSDRPSFEGSRRVVVEPIADEDALLYLRWTEANRRRVAAASGGRLGYIHIPDMGSAGIREFIKWYYGQLRKEGLVIDVRSNGGGNVSQMILERLRHELLMMDYERNTDYKDPYPGAVFHGHLVCLLDEDTASDGDQFAHVFRAAGLGPLVGKRSWGGVVGIYGRGPLIDGGGVSVPEAGSADAQGQWIIEGHGVEPDYVVENTPKAVLEGRDPQLEKGIELLLEMIEKEPMRLPERPEPPVKTE